MYSRQSRKQISYSIQKTAHLHTNNLFRAQADGSYFLRAPCG